MPLREGEQPPKWPIHVTYDKNKINNPELIKWQAKYCNKLALQLGLIFGCTNMTGM